MVVTVHICCTGVGHAQHCRDWRCSALLTVLGSAVQDSIGHCKELMGEYCTGNIQQQQQQHLAAAAATSSSSSSISSIIYLHVSLLFEECRQDAWQEC